MPIRWLRFGSGCQITRDPTGIGVPTWLGIPACVASDHLLLDGTGRAIPSGRERRPPGRGIPMPQQPIVAAIGSQFGSPPGERSGKGLRPSHKHTKTYLVFPGESFRSSGPSLRPQCPAVLCRNPSRAKVPHFGTTFGAAVPPCAGSRLLPAGSGQAPARMPSRRAIVIKEGRTGKGEALGGV